MVKQSLVEKELAEENNEKKDDVKEDSAKRNDLEEKNVKENDVKENRTKENYVKRNDVMRDDLKKEGTFPVAKIPHNYKSNEVPPRFLDNQHLPLQQIAIWHGNCTKGTDCTKDSAIYTSSTHFDQCHGA